MVECEKMRRNKKGKDEAKIMLVKKGKRVVLKPFFIILIGILLSVIIVGGKVGD
jgi:hypothetical protein